MADPEWTQIGASLIGGGAAGACITALVSAYRNRRQPVGHSIQEVPVFRHTLGDSSLQAKITVSDGTNDFQFDNLFLLDVRIVNRGNRDMAQFPFGVTLSEDNKAIHVESVTPDRHHAVIERSDVTPAAPKGEVDFALQPFNRADTYLLKLYVVLPDGRERPGPIAISSPEAIRLTTMPSVGELLAQAARSAVVKVGPMSLQLSRRSRAEDTR